MARSKRKWVWIAFCAVCAGAVVVAVFIATTTDTSVSMWEKQSEAYLSRRYAATFQIQSSRTEEDTVVVTYQTADDRQIVFEVNCWTAGLSTPWGDIAFIPERHYSDDFLEQINSLVIGDSPIDVSGYSVDEIVQFVKSKSDDLCDVYAQYGAEWVTPNFQIEIYCNGIIVSIHYIGQDDSILRDTLVRALFTQKHQD